MRGTGSSKLILDILKEIAAWADRTFGRVLSLGAIVSLFLGFSKFRFVQISSKIRLLFRTFECYMMRNFLKL